MKLNSPWCWAIKPTAQFILLMKICMSTTPVYALVMTGTPAGCALGLPSSIAIRLSGLLPEAKKWELFLNSQKRRKQYLRQGDVIESRIVSRDGIIDLGVQRHVVTTGN